MDGMVALGCDTAPQLRRKLPELRRELNNERIFKVPLLCNFASLILTTGLGCVVRVIMVYADTGEKMGHQLCVF